MSQLSRRSFLRFLGTAPIAVKLGVLEAAEEIFNPHRVIFDMGRSTLWTPNPELLFFNELDKIAHRYIIPVLADEIFKPSPLFEPLRRGQGLPDFNSGEPIRVPIESADDWDDWYS